MGRKNGTGGIIVMTFNGVDPRSLSPKIFVEKEIIDVVPPRDLRVLQASAQAYYTGQDIKPRSIRLRLNFAGRSRTDAYDLTRQTAALFCTDEPKLYIPSHETARGYDAILESASEPDWRWGFGVIEYIFTCPRPYMRSTAPITATGADSIELDTPGTVPIRPVITHQMAEDAAELVISVGDTSPRTIMRLRDPAGEDLQAGAVYVIDYTRRLVTLNGQAANMYVDYTASTWQPEIMPGTAEISLSDAGATSVEVIPEWL